MKFYKENDKSKAICNKCGLVSTTFKVRDVPFSTKNGYARGILAGVCDKCGEVVSVPQQSTPRIKESLQISKKSIEVRLPRHLLDILIVAGDTLKARQPNIFSHFLVKYYIHNLNADKRKCRSLKKYLQTDLAKGKVGIDRLSLKMSPAMYDEFESLRLKTDLNKTQLLKALILKINDDIFSKRYSKDIKLLENIALISG